MSNNFLAVADALDDISAVFEARRQAGGEISASQAASIATGLTHAAEMVRLCDRQRVALLQLLGRPVTEDGVTVVLAPFTVVPGGRS